MNKHYDAIIIGAGIIGACTALELARKGWKTLNVDRLPAAGYGSTSASCAIIRPYYSTVENCALAYEGWFIWMNWADYLGHEDARGMIAYHDTGIVVYKTAANKGLPRVPGLMDAIGCPYEHWSVEQIKQRLPIADLRRFGPVKRPEDDGFAEATGDAVEGAIYFPRGGYVSDPQLAAHNAAAAAEANGATFRFNANVTAIRQDAGQVQGIRLDDGTEIDAPVVINVAGPHSGQVNAMAGVDDDMKIKTRALRHEVAHVPAPAGFDFDRNGLISSDSDVGVYSRPEKGNFILVGSEDPACDTREFVDPDNYNTSFSDQALTQALRMAQRYPGMGIPAQMKGVVDLYDVSDDWNPIYDKSSLKGFYLAIGSSGNQFKNGPLAGRMMTAIIEACENGRDHDNDPVQFHFGNIDMDISLGVFSRNRQINPDSSFSVLG